MLVVPPTIRPLGNLALRSSALPESLLLMLAWSLLTMSSVIERASATPGANIYAEKCAACHGNAGEGVKDRYDGALFGDETLEELAERITETMPEDDPEACVGDEARAVAKYIFEEFYSYDARLAKGLIRRPRVELSRLTVSQLRNSIADLVAHFNPPPRDRRPSEFVTVDAERDKKKGRDRKPAPGGLLGSYHQSKLMNKRDRLVMMRLDSSIDFDFGEESPDKEIDPEAFSIIWNGSLRTSSTGHYEFRITSPNGVRLYLNAEAGEPRGRLRDDDSTRIRTRLIDGWVSSGETRTLGARIFLLGGRTYPLRLEYFKFKDPNASVRLEWKPPHGVWSVLDSLALRPAPATRTLVVDTPFPPDDRSLGYERGSSVSTEWQTAVSNAALAAADEIIARLPSLAGVDRDSWRAPASYVSFTTKLASLAFRRPLTDEEMQLYGTDLFQDSEPETAVRRAVLLILTSPHFLYTDLTPPDQPPTAHAIASRLAFALWDSIPDEKLRKAAERGQLHSREQIASQAQRMLDDPRARAKMHNFFQHWLEMEERDLAKDKQMFPEFDEAVVADLRTSLETFVDRVVWGKSSDYRELLKADYLLLNERLQQLYGQPSPKDVKASKSPKYLYANHPFAKVSNSKEGRSGVLTHPYLLSAFAYHNNTSPIHRGVFLTRNIVGRQLKPPPVAVAFENSDFAPDLTMREKITQLTRDQACLSCHEVINPLGFALENFDAVGRWRTEENDKPIDASGDFTSTEGTKVKISSPRDIADFAVNSPVAQRAFVKQIFQHLVRQDPVGYGPETIEELREAFVADKFHVRKLLVHVATRAAAYNPTE